MSRPPPYASPLALASIAGGVVALAAGYSALRLPAPPRHVDHKRSLSARSHLSFHSSHWDIYPEDFYPGGAYVNLPAGRTRYWLFGPEDGKRIVLVSGLQVPALIWDKTARGLAEKGFRVLIYDIYGRGHTDAPRIQYNTELYTTQLALLLQHVGWSSAHVAGVSMGGAIATAFAVNFPWLVSSVALLCPVGLFKDSDFPMAFNVGTAPPVIALSGFLQAIKRGIFTRTPCLDPLDEIVALQTSHVPGFRHAVASSIRHGPVRGLEPEYKRLGELSAMGQVRVLLVWGTADVFPSFDTSEVVKKYIPNLEFVPIKDGPHDLPTTNPKEVVDALVHFFK